MRPGAVSTVLMALVTTVSLVPAALAKGIVPRFDLADPAGSPFPSDRFTVPDASQLTGLRVNLPAPDCVVRPTDCEDVAVLDTLDGFNLQPRLSIPFSGPIDVASVSSETVFLLELGPALRFIGINQVVWDTATLTLHVESDALLEERTRYVLVVTNGVRDLTGDPIGAAPFRRFLSYGQTSDAAEKAYRISLIQALELLESADVSERRVVAASLFTTQSATAVMEKIRGQIDAATPATVDFHLGPAGERTVFPIAGVASIAFSRQTGTAPTFQTASLPLNLLSIVPGTIATVAFGRYASPDYETPGKFIPPVATLSGIPVVQGSNDVYFDLFVPSASKPPDGWPVVIFGHGRNGNKTAALRVAAKLAQHGLATMAINTVGHGGGPLGTLRVNRPDGTFLTLPAGGRGIDQDGNGAIGTSEGFSAASPQRIVQNRDGNRQTVIDAMSLVRALQAGVDVDDDGGPDFDPSRIYYVGGSGGGIIGAQFLALEPSVAAGVVNVMGGGLIEVVRLTAARQVIGAALGARIPSLLNGGPDPILPSNPFPFRESLPLRDQAPVVNDVPGAMAIQELFERVEWVMQSGETVAYAPHLRARPLDGVGAKDVLIQFAKGDKQIPNPTTSAFLRAGDLADRATYFRNDLAFAADPTLLKDPHEFWYNVFTSPAATAIALKAEEQVAAFLESDGVLIADPDGAEPLFETPIAGPLPEDLSFIP
jgi:dienelactone hydrolase